jgi:hypothetical protein
MTVRFRRKPQRERKCPDGDSDSTVGYLPDPSSWHRPGRLSVLAIRASWHQHSTVRRGTVSEMIDDHESRRRPIIASAKTPALASSEEVHTELLLTSVPRSDRTPTRTRGALVPQLRADTEP